MAIRDPGKHFIVHLLACPDSKIVIIVGHNDSSEIRCSIENILIVRAAHAIVNGTKNIDTPVCKSYTDRIGDVFVRIERNAHA